jgi:hypothetical protein
MKRKLLFPIIAALLLAPWPVAYAYDNASAGNIPTTIEAAEASAAPRLNGYGNAIGNVTPGDLFYIDNSGATGDTLFTLSITNADELVHSYRYMTLNIGIYVQMETDRWEKLNMSSGEMLLETCITMQGGMVSFSLPGGARYKIGIDKGCFYCYGAKSNDSIPVPKFYLTTG